MMTEHQRIKIRYTQLQTDMNYYMTDPNLDHFRRHLKPHLKGPTQWTGKDMFQLITTLESMGKVSPTKMTILLKAVEELPEGAVEVEKIIKDAEADIKKIISEKKQQSATGDSSGLRRSKRIRSLSRESVEYSEDDDEHRPLRTKRTRLVSQESSGEKFHNEEDHTAEYDDLKVIMDRDVGRSVGFISLVTNDRISNGTGFCVGNKYMMTAYHVFEDKINDLKQRIIRKMREPLLKDEEERTRILQGYGQILGNITYITPENIEKYVAEYLDPVHKPLKIGTLLDNLKSSLGEAVTGRFLDSMLKIWTKAVTVKFGPQNPEAKCYSFTYDIPFADKKHDILILQLDVEESEIQNLPPPLELAEHDVHEKMHLVGFPATREHGLGMLLDINCEVYKDSKKLETDIKNAKNAQWWKNNSDLCVENAYASCYYENNSSQTTKGHRILHASKKFEYRASGSPAIATNRMEGKPVVQLMYIEGHPKVCYKTQRFPPQKHMFEAGISMQFVAYFLKCHKQLRLKRSLFDLEEDMSC